MIRKFFKMLAGGLLALSFGGIDTRGLAAERMNCEATATNVGATASFRLKRSLESSTETGPMMRSRRL